MTWFAWSLLSACFAAATAILAKVGVSGVDANYATAIRTSVIVLFTWAIAWAAPGSSANLLSLAPRTWLFLALSGIATGLSWLCYFRALQLGPASRVAPVDKLSVILVILCGSLFLGERLTSGKLVGGLLILAGVLVVALE